MPLVLDVALPLHRVPNVAATGTKAEFIKSAPSRQQLAERSGKFYEAAKASTVGIKPDSYARVITSMETMLTREGANEVLHPKVYGAFNALAKKAGQPMDSEKLQTARRQIGIALRSAEPDERRIAMIMRDMLDEFVDNLGVGDLNVGSIEEAAAAANSLKNARRLWHLQKKMETVTEIVEKARNQASGFENGLRVGFRALLNNKKRLRGFTADEIALLKRIARGTVGTNFLKLLSRLSFSPQGGNFLGGSIGVGAGYTLAGAPGAVIAPAVGAVAKAGVERSTRSATKLLEAVVGAGGDLPPFVSGLSERLMRATGPLAGTQVPSADGLTWDPEAEEWFRIVDGRRVPAA